jgi:hypothetical protein
MQPKHWLDPLLALNPNGLHELMGSVAQQHQASYRSNFSRKSARASDWGELCRCA